MVVLRRKNNNNNKNKPKPKFPIHPDNKDDNNTIDDNDADGGSLSPDSDTLLDRSSLHSETLAGDRSSHTLQNVTVQQSQQSSSSPLLKTSAPLSKEANLKSPVKMVDGQLEVQMFATVEEFEAHLPDTVTVLEGPFGARVYLIGSAHFSEESMNDVSFVIRNVRPDFVMVELCASRSHIMLMDEAQLMHEATDLNLAKIRDIYKSNGLNSIFYILLLSMSSKLSKDLGVAPGCEFRRAYREARMIQGCTVHLGDRPIGVTINRMLRSLSIWDTVKLGWRLLTADDKMTPEEVEECKNESMLEKCMADLAKDFPAFDQLFVKERDQYLAYSLASAAMPVADAQGMPRAVTVVGVVGIGHAAGIKKNWGRVTREQIVRIMEIPEPQLSKRVLKAVVKCGFYGLICWGVYKVVRPRLPAMSYSGGL